MVSDIINEELRLTYERLRMTLVILFFWVIITTLDIPGIINLEDTGNNFLIYAIMAASAIIFLILALGIQAEPLIKQVIKNRKEIDKFWESEERLKPSIEKRTKISEIILVFAIIVMMVALLFVMV
ncbi:MAG: hypothetical protein HeimAB125_19070 [Candidatus Heimdallarchaeota archaeon AB_125]|nr:MAG: hypothetical protein HeimAB125_19070 [Candidatus Heimdallarchaeota archaeon AB_125]